MLDDALKSRKTAMTVDEVAEILNISAGQVYKLVKRRKLPAFRVPGSASVRFDPAKIAAIFEHQPH